VQTEPPAPQGYKVSSNFYGDVCVPEEDLIPAMQGSLSTNVSMASHHSLIIMVRHHQVKSTLIVMIVEILSTLLVSIISSIEWKHDGPTYL
jgi:hypothetical protein